MKINIVYNINNVYFLFGVMWMDTRKLRRQQVAQRFVDCTCAIIEQEGMQQLNIRKVAQMAGYHSSTVYLYFKDFPHLILQAVLQFLDRYARYMEQDKPDEEDALSCYLRCMTRFCEFSIAHPNIFSAVFVDSYGDISTEEVTGEISKSSLLTQNIEVLQQMSVQLNIPPTAVRQLNDTVMALCIGSILILTRERTDCPPEQLVTQTMHGVRVLIDSYCRTK